MRSPGRSATSGSRLFISIRRAASWGHPLQDRFVPRGARTSGTWATRIRESLAAVDVQWGLGLTEGDHQAAVAARGGALRPVTEGAELDAAPTVHEDERDVLGRRFPGVLG